MIIEDYNFSMQFWVSGGEINGSEAPALFSITDNNETKLALYRDPNINNSIILNINSQIVKLPELNPLKINKIEGIANIRKNESFF